LVFVLTIGMGEGLAKLVLLKKAFVANQESHS